MNLSKVLFWDVDYNSIDFDKHSGFVVERVLCMGTLEDFKAINSYYGKTKLKAIVKNIRYMDERVLQFCSVYFNITKTDFRCYKQKQLNISHWNY